MSAYSFSNRSIFERLGLTISRPLPPAIWTALGTLAVPLWATWPTLAHLGSEMPVFEMLTIAFLVGYFVLLFCEPVTEVVPEQSRGDVLAVAACALGLLGSNALFVIAVEYIPPAQANVLSYLWPVMVVGIGAALGLFQFRLLHGVSLALGFTGIIVIAGVGSTVLSPVGIALGLLSGLSWASFTVFRIWQGAKARPVLARGCLISAGLSLALHLSLEPLHIPTLPALLAAVGVGILPLALANLCWDLGVRRGDSRMLATMAYGTPLVGLVILAIFGLTVLTDQLLIGAALVVLAGILTSKTQ